MAFGLLGSIIPQINRNEVVYTSPVSNLAFGKVSISSKNYNPAKIRVGITTDDINIEYLEYNRFINYGETFESEIIYVGNGQKLIARSDNANVNFLFYGETIDETVNPQKSGLLNSVLSTNNQKKYLYSPPSDCSATVTLSVCNLNSLPAKARIGLSNASVGSFDSTEYLEYDVEIGPHQTYTRTDIKLSQPQTLICSSSEDSNINFLCHGKLVFGGVASNDLVVAGDATISGDVGIGTANARQKLDVVGNALIDGTLTVGDGLEVTSGNITGNINTASLNQSLINLTTLPAINGSALIGVVATGTGIQVREDGTPVGTASTINFGPNLLANFNAGIASVRLSDSVNVNNDFTVAVNRFAVNGTTGNTEVFGSLVVGSNASVSGDVNVLNNKVINVGSATSTTDATNKRYVDTRSIAMSIALS